MRWPLLVLVCVLLLAGCGDVEPSTSPTPTVESNATEAPTPSSTAGPNATADTTAATSSDDPSAETPPSTGRATPGYAETITPGKAPTPVPQQTATATPGPTSSSTPTATATAAETATATATPNGTQTATQAATPTPTATERQEQRSSWTVEVVRVIDGDTMDVRMPDGSEDTIRLLGVDTPETSASQTDPDEWEGIPDDADGRQWLESWGHEATGYAEERLGGEEIYIETDSESDRRGSYDRLLVYASQSESAEKSFNLRLIENGYARMYDTQFSQRSTYQGAESQAQDDDVGVWDYEARSTTPTATPDGGSGQQPDSLVVSEVHADAAGNDHENLNDEYVEFTNEGDSAIDVTGWTLSDEADHTYQFPSGFTLGAGDSVTVYTGSGDDTEDELYWGSGRAVWNNGGDTIYVRDDAGETVIEHEYSG